MTQTARPVVDWTQIDTVLVDMDGTLLDLAFDNVFWLEVVPACFARARGLSAEDARREVAARSDRTAWTLEWYCLDHWSRDLSLDLIQVCVKPTHLHLVTRLELLKLAAQVRHFLLAIGEPIFQTIENFFLFGEFDLFWRQFFHE